MFSKKTFHFTITFSLIIAVFSCNSSKEVIKTDNKKESIVFTEANETIIPLSKRPRKKWDSAIIVDLDLDGLQDMILIEHSWKVLIFWNNGRKFSKPQTLLNGDLHGVVAADYDNDGLMNLLVVQGGGGGSKLRTPLLYQVNKDRTITDAKQMQDLENTRGRAAKLIDADANGTLDLLLTAFAAPKQLKLGVNHIHENKGDGDFKFLEKLPHGQRLSYKTVVTDFNNDYDQDFIIYGGEDVIVIEGIEGLKFKEADKTVLGEASKTKEVSSATEIDFDNDGDFDLFFTRNQHAFKQETFFDEANNRFAFFTRFKPFKYEDLKIDGNFKIENLQMAFPDFDVFIGKDKRLSKPDKPKNRDYRNLTLTPEEADGFPEDMDKKGIYIGYVGNGFWRIAGDTKAPISGVVHNVTSRPKIKPLELMPAVLLENRDGVFVDVTSEKGISIPEQTTSATSGDFNNDGWSDLFVVRYGNPATKNEQILLLNNQGKSFTSVKNHGLISNEIGATGGFAQTIDYDTDGDLDIIYSNERGLWHLYTNNSTNENNFVTIKVGKSPGNKTPKASAMGAVVTIKACGNIYKRVVGASSSPYSNSLDNMLHIGLGTCGKIDEAKVRWSNGEVLDFDIKDLNTSIFVGN